MLISQNFSIPAGDDGVLQFDVEPEQSEVLTDMTIVWAAYEQQFGCPTPNVDAVIYKSNAGGGMDIVIADSPSYRFYVYLDAADTVGLLRNYYHEACYFDSNGKKVTITAGIMTVLETENRPSGL